MLLEIAADEAWKPTASEAIGGVVAIGYTCPGCNGLNEIRVQPPEAPQGAACTSVETELWCHRCQRGTAASIVRN